MNNSMKPFPIFLRILLCGGALLSAVVNTLQAGSATWKLSPATNDWWVTSNWTPETVPNDSADVATFDVSNTTGIILRNAVTVDSMVFNSSASPFTFTPSFITLTLTGAGIINNSGATQSFVANGGGNGPVSTVSFLNSATAANGNFAINGATVAGGFGAQVSFNDNATAANATFATFGGVGGGGGGGLGFRDNASAANCTIINNATVPGGSQSGSAGFADDATAENATITNNGGTTNGSLGGYLSFFGNATAANANVINQGGAVDGAGGGWTMFTSGGNGGNATFTCNGGGSANAGGGFIDFSVGANAGNATLIANSSPFAGTVSGGLIQFDYDSDGGRARIILNGNGHLNISYHDDTIPVGVGSIEGDGLVTLVDRDLIVGRNNRDATFKGKITAYNSNGTITKVGRGSWNLTKNNPYQAGTFIKGGQLIASNKVGSATGIGPVQIFDGALAGQGIVAGAVTVGASAAQRAQISPGSRGAQDTGTLTLQQTVTFTAYGDYTFQIDSDNSLSDTLTAAGAVINAGAQFIATDLGATPLTAGMVFTVLNNTGAAPISGTFTNLADGRTITIGSNNFLANYSGGDGNDLTLTVVP